MVAVSNGLGNVGPKPAGVASKTANRRGVRSPKSRGPSNVYAKSVPPESPVSDIAFLIARIICLLANFFETTTVARAR